MTLFSKTQNMIYYGLSRLVFGICICMMIVPIFLENVNVLKIFLSSKYFKVLGKVALEGGLLFPIVMLGFLANSEYAYYVTFWNVVCLAVGNIIVLTLLGMLIYLFYEY